MRYMLMAWDPVTYWDETDDADQMADIEVYGAFARWLREQGMLVAAEGLRAPSTATTVRKQGDDIVISDGPYLELNETLGGFYLIDVPDLDAALEVARRCPSTTIELRPVEA